MMTSSKDSIQLNVKTWTTLDSDTVLYDIRGNTATSSIYASTYLALASTQLDAAVKVQMSRSYTLSHGTNLYTLSYK